MFAYTTLRSYLPARQNRPITIDRVNSQYRDSKILVTGGLGFIGSNLAVRLGAAGADVTVIDSSVPGCGSNPHNICGARVRVIAADIGDASRLKGIIRGSAIVFNLAGEISHTHSMRWPERDAELNAVAQLRFLQECASQAPGVRVVFASTRQVYGLPRYLPVDEVHSVGPVDFNGIHKYLAGKYHELFTSTGTVDAVVLRLTNVYGPRMALNNPCQGFLSTFLRNALVAQRIQIFGDGSQVRDPVYVDDVVDAFLLAGSVHNLPARLYNVGGLDALPLRRIAEIISAAAGAPPPVLRPFPEDRKKIDIGNYVTDSSLIRKTLGWRPRVRFEQGICRTLEYYRSHLENYLIPGDGEPCCVLEA